MALLKFCGWGNCQEVVPKGQSYCSRHAPMAEARKEAWLEKQREKLREKDKARERARNIERGSAHQRGYNYAWSKFSKEYRKAHPWCAICASKGIVTPSACVDHIKPLKDHPELKYDKDNLQALCWRCHTLKTIKEEGALRGKKK